MRLPRPRFTVRRLMAVVAVVALLMAGSIAALRAGRQAQIYRSKAQIHARIEVGLWEHLVYCRKMAQRMRRAATAYQADRILWPDGDSRAHSSESEAYWWHLNELHTSRLIPYHAALNRKYERAAWRPWLVVDPDPPAPYWDGTAGEPPGLLSPGPVTIIDLDDKDQVEQILGGKLDVLDRGRPD